MRRTIWLSIAVFVTTLYWPQLLNNSALVSCMLFFFIFLYWPKWRYLAIVPMTAVYFTTFSYINLLGVTLNKVNPLTTSISMTQTLPVSKAVDRQPVSFLSEQLTTQDNNITVQIKSLINIKNNGYFIANIISINNQKCYFCPLIEMRWFAPTLPVQAGQIHQFKVRLKALQGKGNPDGFDRQKWRYSNHIAYIASIKKHLNVVDDAISIRASLYLKTLEVTQNLSQQGAMMALIFADKSLMSYQDKETIKKLGIAHLFAISGLHIGLMFVFSFVLFNALVNNLLPIHFLGWFSWRLTHLLSFAVCFGYGYISGFSLPTERALLMLFISMLMLSNKRKVRLFDLLILCLWLILLLDPLAILSSSLWLSFTAMSAIFVFVWVKQNPDKQRQEELSWWQVLGFRVFIFFKWLLLLQLVLTLFMLPIQLINFSAISTLSLVINLIAIPLFSWLIIPATLLGTLSLIVYQPLGEMLLNISHVLLQVFLDYSEPLVMGYFPLSRLDILLILSSVIFILLLLFVFFLGCFFEFNKKHIVLLPLSFIAFIGVRVLEKVRQEKQSWQVEVFDIGQGLAVLVKSDNQYLLYDSGPSYPPNYAVAKVEMLPYLQAQGIKQIDYLVISHSDKDHAGGAKSLQEALTIKKAYAGEPALMDNTNTAYKQCLSGQTFYLGKVTLEVLSPTETVKNNNNNSCVIKVSDGEHSLLLTGDINKKLEKQLVDRSLQTSDMGLLEADILIAPHHGSKTSSSRAFIYQVDPRWVVFSAGYKNRWHFPITEVVARYQEHGALPLTTGNSGFIRFNVQNHQIEVKTYREDLAAYWYHQQL